MVNKSFYAQFIEFITDTKEKEYIRKTYDLIASGQVGLEIELQKLCQKYMTTLQASLFVNEAVKLYKRKRFDLMLETLSVNNSLFPKEEILEYARENNFSSLEVEFAALEGLDIKMKQKAYFKKLLKKQKQKSERKPTIVKFIPKKK